VPLAVAGTLLGVMALTFASKIMAFGRDVALSSIYGAGSDTDAFFLANAIPAVIWSAFWTTIGMVFMPLYTAERRRSVRASSAFANNAVLLYAGLSVALTLLCIVSARQLILLTSPDSSEAVVTKAAHLTMIMSLGFFFSGYVSIQNAIQQSKGQLLPPLVVPLLNNLFAIVGVVVSYFWGGIYLVVVFLVLGWVVQAPLQRAMTRKFYKATLGGKPWSDAATRRLLVLSVPVFFGVFLDQINLYIGVYLSAGFGEGAISHLNYANRLTGLMAGLFSMLVAYLVFPRLAAAAARDQEADVAAVLARGLGSILATTAPMAIIGLSLSHELVSLVFGRGAFGGEDVTAAAAIFQFYVYGVLFIAVREIFNRTLFSYHKTGIPLYIGLLSAAVNIGVSVVLTKMMGPTGVAAGASAAAIFYVALQIAYLLRWKPNLLNGQSWRWALAVTSASICMIAVIRLVVPEFADSTPLVRLVVAVLASMPAYALGFFACARFIGVK
jgi:putative peptidoglycan lipid II flippase